jgi:hypothetical protein
MPLPRYAPPLTHHATVAAGLAPLAVLLTFTLVVTRLIDADTGLAVLAASTLWVAIEMHAHQRRLDSYNADYVQRHLAWRTSATLRALANSEVTDPATRDFVERYVDAGRRLRPDGPALG